MDFLVSWRRESETRMTIVFVCLASTWVQRETFWEISAISHPGGPYPTSSSQSQPYIWILYSHPHIHTYEYHGTGEPSLPDEDASHLSVDGAQVTKWVPRHTSHLVSAELIGSSESVKGTRMKLISADEPPKWWCLYFHMGPI